MSPLDKAPCRGGLSPTCFTTFPKWAKQALAYRLLHFLLPPEITAKLPEVLNKPLLYPGPLFPEDWTPSDPLPEGVLIDTKPLFPADWQEGDPPPAGVFIPPGTSFPEAWQEGDPPPPGVIIPPGTSFPADWNPPSPVPDTIVSETGAPMPSGWQPGDMLPINFSFALSTIFGPDWQFGDFWPEAIYLFNPIDLPADMILTDGTTVAPGTTFPPAPTLPINWQPGDPVPAGVTIPTATVFPPDYQPGDPAPQGVGISPPWSAGDPTPGVLSFSPGYSFPKYWHHGDPIPPGLEVNTLDLFPPGWTFNDPLPEGLLIDSALFFPEGWQYGDEYPSEFSLTPRPDGPFFVIAPPTDPQDLLYSPRYLFPPGWQPGDLLPPNVSYDLSLLFPSGWQPGDPLPFGLMVDFLLLLPPGWDPESLIDYGWGYPTVRPDVLSSSGPYYYLSTFEGIMQYMPRNRNPSSLGIYFEEHFNILDTNIWTLEPTPTGSMTLVDGRFRNYSASGFGWGNATASGSGPVASNYDLSFLLKIVSSNNKTQITFSTATYGFWLSFDEPSTARIRLESGYQTFYSGDFMDTDIVWKAEVRGDQVTLFMDGVQKGDTYTIGYHGSPDGLLRLASGRTFEVFWDDILVDQNV